MAELYLSTGDKLTGLSFGGLVFGAGGTGTESVSYLAGISGITVDANVEQVNLAEATSAYTFQQQGTALIVFSGTTQVARINVQNDTNGTLVAFANGLVEVKIVAGVGGAAPTITLGGATVPSASASPVIPVTIDGSGATGAKTLTLTAAIDAGAAFTGTAGNDTFIGDNTTTSGADQLDGGNGSDTLRLFSTTTLPGTTSIETIEFNTIVSGAANVASRADVTTVAVRDSSLTGAVDLTVAGTQAVTLNKVDGAQAVNIASAASVTAQTVNLIGNGATAAPTVDFKGTGVAAATLNATGSGSSVVVANTGAALKTLNVTGDAALTITGDVPGATKIVSTNTAGLTASTATASSITTAGGKDSITLNQANTVGVFAATTAIDLGAGDDTLKITNANAADRIAAGATFKGGDGNDTLNVVNGALLNAATGAQFSGFETLSLIGSSGTFEVGTLASTNTISSIQVGALGGATTLNNVPEAASVAFVATTAQNLTVNQKDAGAGSPDDVINTAVAGKAAITVSNVDFNDIETVNVSSLNTGTTAGIVHTFTQLVATEATKLTINASTAGLTIANLDATAAVLIDASASTSKVSITTGADTFAATAGVAFKLGAGDDTIVLTGANTSAGSATALDFVVTGNGGADTITLSAAGQVEQVVYLAQADSTAAKFDTISNFTTTEDKIDIKAFGFTGNAAASVLTKVGVATIGTSGEFSVTTANAGNFFDDSGIDRAVVETVIGGDLYVVVDADKNGDFNAGTDLVIKLAGLTAAGFAAGDLTFA